VSGDRSQYHSLANPALREQYLAAGFAGRVGWGERPAVLVIDMAGAWTTPEEQLGSDLGGVVAQITRILDVARERGDVPIIFTTMAYGPDLKEIGHVVRRKTPHTELMIRGSERVQLIPELGRRPDEPLIEKPRASAFFGTNLLSMLISEGIDTVVVVGCSTSGCIRATAESAFNDNFHVIVPAEAVGDRSWSAHEGSLFDIDARLGDVVPVEDVLAHLAAMDRSAAPGGPRS
jgi:nicotinamidase-related amidase